MVYNHFGPEGNSLLLFSEIYLTDRHPDEWGQAARHISIRGNREFSASGTLASMAHGLGYSMGPQSPFPAVWWCVLPGMAASRC